MEKLLISACFLGERVRYDGGDNLLVNTTISQWQTENRLIVICPEISGGLAVPRPPAELQYLDNSIKVTTIAGQDVTAAFQLGAQKALQLCQTHHIRYALLKESSPSCGGLTIYDGTFTGRKIAGQGVTAALLRANGIAVYSEKTIKDLLTIFNLNLG